jgi:hypothetical protein
LLEGDSTNREEEVGGPFDSLYPSFDSPTRDPLTVSSRERERERREEMASKTEDLSKGILFRETFTVNSRDRDGKKLPTCNVNKEGCDGCKACKVPHFQQYVTTFSRC